MRIFFVWAYKRRLLWLVMVCFIGISLDQISKIWAQNYLAEPYEVFEKDLPGDDGQEKKPKKEYYPIRIVSVIPQSFNLIYKENRAAAFSLTESIPLWFRRPMLIFISLIAGIFFAFWYFRLKEAEAILVPAFSLILAGALGNFIDRVRLGYVIDFLDVYAGFLGYPHLHWPTFNVADSLIVMGAILVFISAFKPNADKKA